VYQQNCGSGKAFCPKKCEGANQDKNSRKRETTRRKKAEITRGAMTKLGTSTTGLAFLKKGWKIQKRWGLNLSNVGLTKGTGGTRKSGYKKSQEKKA